MELTCSRGEKFKLVYYHIIIMCQRKNRLSMCYLKCNKMAIQKGYCKFNILYLQLFFTSLFQPPLYLYIHLRMCNSNFAFLNILLVLLKANRKSAAGKRLIIHQRLVEIYTYCRHLNFLKLFIKILNLLELLLRDERK